MFELLQQIFAKLSLFKMRLALPLFLFCLAYIAATEANQAFVYHYANHVEPRQFWPTSTTTTTSIFTSTCTQYTSSTCGIGRRRRGVLLEEADHHGQFSVAASPVQE